MVEKPIEATGSTFPAGDWAVSTHAVPARAVLVLAEPRVPGYYALRHESRQRSGHENVMTWSIDRTRHAHSTPRRRNRPYEALAQSKAAREFDHPS